jgi:uncharacterized membrane protein YbhN (UPF0104 family)
MGEVLRVGLASSPVDGDRARSLAAGVGVLVVEKLLDAAVLLVTVAALVLLVGVPEWLSRGVLITAVVGCVVGVAIAFRLRQRGLVIARTWLARWLPSRAAWLLDEATAVGEGLSAWLTWGQAVRALVWSLVAWGLGGVTNAVVFQSVGVQPKQTLAAALAILAALYGAAVVPTLPGRLGIFQYLCVVTLAPFGVPLEQALVFSLALYIVVYVPPVLIGLGSIVMLGRMPWARSVARPARR